MIRRAFLVSPLALATCGQQPAKLTDTARAVTVIAAGLAPVVVAMRQTGRMSEADAAVAAASLTAAQDAATAVRAGGNDQTALAATRAALAAMTSAVTRVLARDQLTAAAFGSLVAMAETLAS
jgi:hypothetical protein